VAPSIHTSWQSLRRQAAVGIVRLWTQTMEFSFLVCSPQANIWTEPQMRLRPLPFRNFPNHYFVINHHLTLYIIVTESLNEPQINTEQQMDWNTFIF
jgi:hypothetical protein